MKVTLIAWPGEGEYDFWLSCKQNDINVEFFFVDQGNIKGYLGQGDNPPDIQYKLISTGDVRSIINQNSSDLYVLKYPQTTWSLPATFNRTICWLTEQGITRQYAEGSSSPYPNVGVNNKMDMQYYSNRNPGKKVLYMPFGCYAVPEYFTGKIYDLIADGRICNPSVNSPEATARRGSTNVMVQPFLGGDYNIALYGGGWETDPATAPYHKGMYPHHEYPQILSQAKLYLGFSWNWQHSGFGIKIARALSTGIPMLWHNTPGMELEGWEKGNQLDWSSSAEETKHLVDYYLNHDKERIEMGKRGQEWCMQNWEWSKILERIVNEL